MRGSTTPDKPSRRPLVLLIAVAVAGLAAAGLLYSQSRNLQAKLDDAAQESEAAQTRFDDASKELQQTRSELERVQAELIRQRQRLTEASNQLQEVQGELETAESQVAQMVPGADEAGEMPIMFGFRKAPTGGGYILWFQNKTTKALSLKITTTGTTGRKTRPLQVVLEGATLSGTGFFAAAIKEIGSAEGRTFASGDRIDIACPGYGPMKKTLP